MHGDTVVALSTPPGTSGLAVLRLSGPACKAVLLAALGKPDAKPRRMHHGPFRDPVGGEVLDKLNFVHLPGPNTVTGEDVLEIFPHGNMLLVDRMLACLLAMEGIRMALPGEFTRRGFENGKIDLLQAEAVGQLIHAQTSGALRNAQRIVAGEMSSALKELRSALVDISVRLELEVDFSEEEADPDFSSWLPRLESIRFRLAALSRSFENGRSLGRRPRMVIVGAPNAGKSSLINSLVETERLLVSDLPGTTRDYVDIPLRLPGGMVELVDTAGLGRPVDGLDQLAMAGTRSQWDKADLRIWVEDGTRPDGIREPEGISVDRDFALRVQTRMDLPGFQYRQGYLAVSNRSKEGLGELRMRLDALAFRDRSQGEDLALTTERQFQAVDGAAKRVEAALETLRTRPAIEIVAFEIREATVLLKELLGEISSDEVLARLFSGFCIGK